MASAIDDIAYLTRSDHRAPTLVALAVRPRSRSELWEMAGVSESTIRRTLREFEDRGWIQRDGYQYETTELGEYIATAVAELIDRFETERQLRGVWEWLPDANSGFTLEMCTDATITVADADNPYRPVTRFVQLLKDTAHAKFISLDVAMLEPCREEFCHQIIDGMETEVITRPRVVNYIRSSYPEMFTEALDSGNLTVRLHDDLPPYGVCLFDERIVICGYDIDNVSVRVLIDTETAVAREWAESIYTTYRRETPTVGLNSE